jgi:hypothetical protein
MTPVQLLGVRTVAATPMIHELCSTILGQHQQRTCGVIVEKLTAGVVHSSHHTPEAFGQSNSGTCSLCWCETWKFIGELGNVD